MTALDDKVLPKVKARLEKVAIDATWTTNANLAVDPVTSEASEASPDAHAVRLSPPSDAASYDAPEAGESGQTVVFVAGQGLPFTPDLGHRVAFHGRTWVVVGLKAPRPGDQVAVWRVHLEGGDV